MAVLVHAEWWKKYSTPLGAAMKPKPLSVMRLIVPVVGAITADTLTAGRGGSRVRTHGRRRFHLPPSRDIPP